jgi:uncharacterized membrane-anchored protein YhcB (DUF1043 family)
MSETKLEGLVDELQQWRSNAEKRFATLAAKIKVLVDEHTAIQSQLSSSTATIEKNMKSIEEQLAKKLKTLVIAFSVVTVSVLVFAMMGLLSIHAMGMLRDV